MRFSLDGLTRVALQARALATVVGLVFVCSLAPSLAQADDLVVHGAILPGGCTKAGEDRFNTGMSWEFVWKFYEKVYPRSKYERLEIANQPAVKAVHLKNPETTGKWDGLNVYEHQGRVKIFVVKRALKPAADKPAKEEKPEAKKEAPKKSQAP